MNISPTLSTVNVATLWGWARDKTSLVGFFTNQTLPLSNFQDPQYGTKPGPLALKGYQHTGFDLKFNKVFILIMSS